jgi:hypothetical protein
MQRPSDGHHHIIINDAVEHRVCQNSNKRLTYSTKSSRSDACSSALRVVDDEEEEEEEAEVSVGGAGRFTSVVITAGPSRNGVDDDREGNDDEAFDPTAAPMLTVRDDGSNDDERCC